MSEPVARYPLDDQDAEGTIAVVTARALSEAMGRYEDLLPADTLHVEVTIRAHSPSWPGPRTGKQQPSTILARQAQATLGARVPEQEGGDDA